MITPIDESTKTKTSIFYMNDFHGKISNLERLYTASNAFDTFESNSDKLKLSSGDDGLGEDPAIARAVSKLLDMIGISKRQTGNHEYDVNPEIHAQVAKDAKYQELGAVNIHIKPESKLNGILVSSAIEEVNGHKYGIVGIGPSDMAHRLKSGVSKNDLSVDDLETTINNLQIEVDKLKAQGLDKIILLSHSGYTNDIKIAEQTSGIDIILGGHSHDLIKDITLGKNLIYNKDGEPVIITQAGKDGENFGILNVEFDDKGIITKAQNNVMETKDFNRMLSVKYAVEEIIGKPEYIGLVKTTLPAPKNRMIENNPHANYITDAMHYELGTDLAILNAGNIRGSFELGAIDSRMITEISPFKNKMVIIKLSEKDLVDAVKLGGTAFKKPGNKPGLLMPSGFKYKMNKNGDLLSLSIIGKNNSEIPVDINNPRVDKIYSVAMDDFYAKGGDGFTMLNKFDKADVVYDFDKDKLVCDYIKHNNGIAEIKNDNRIIIV